MPSETFDIEDMAEQFKAQMSIESGSKWYTCVTVDTTTGFLYVTQKGSGQSIVMPDSKSLRELGEHLIDCAKRMSGK